MVSKARFRNRTMQQRVWHWMRRKKGPVTVKMVVVKYEISRQRAANTLRSLCRKGSAERAGNTSATVYRPTKIEPEDMRGLSVNSIAALLKNASNRKKNETTQASGAVPKVRRPSVPALGDRDSVLQAGMLTDDCVTTDQRNGGSHWDWLLQNAASSRLDSQ